MFTSPAVGHLMSVKFHVFPYKGSACSCWFLSRSLILCIRDSGGHMSPIMSPVNCPMSIHLKSTNTNLSSVNCNLTPTVTLL